VGDLKRTRVRDIIHIILHLLETESENVTGIEKKGAHTRQTITIGDETTEKPSGTNTIVVSRLGNGNFLEIGNLVIITIDSFPHRRLVIRPLSTSHRHDGITIIGRVETTIIRRHVQ
jgi:transcriptional regulator of heat shock response